MAAATALLWVALYYLPVGGPLFRMALPLPLALLYHRHGRRAGLMGISVTCLLLTALMGPIRGLLVLCPYGCLGLWLGSCWRRGQPWALSWSVGVPLASLGLVVRVAVLSLLVGDNLWVIFTTAGAKLLDWLVGLASALLAPLLTIGFSPGLIQVQLAAIVVILIQNTIYLLSLHAIAYWIFPRLGSPMPQPPRQLLPLIALDPL